MSIVFGSIPTLLVLLPLFIVYGAIRLWRRSSPIFRRRNPVNHEMLRSPGDTIRVELEEIELDITGLLIAIMMTPLLFYSIAITLRVYDDAAFGKLNIFIYVTATIITEMICGQKLIALIQRRRNLTIGLEAEVSVGQSLNELVRDGAMVFHDFPAEKFNIDHIVVSPKGVFAVETKGRSKPLSESGRAAFALVFDGKTLNFPDHIESAPIEQARRQARWLQEWLSSATGEPTEVKPVLAIPGWRIEFAGSSDVFVFNPKYPGLMLQSRKSYLTQEQIKRIAHQLDSRCRNVSPTN